MTSALGHERNSAPRIQAAQARTWLGVRANEWKRTPDTALAPVDPVTKSFFPRLEPTNVAARAGCYRINVQSTTRWISTGRMAGTSVGRLSVAVVAYIVWPILPPCCAATLRDAFANANSYSGRAANHRDLLINIAVRLAIIRVTYLSPTVHRFRAGYTLPRSRICPKTCRPSSRSSNSEEKITGFLSDLDGMIGSGLVTLEKVKVLQYGTKDKS